MSRSVHDRVQPHPHPAVYSVLMLPFGAVGGYLTVALAFVLSHSGVSATEVGLLIATYGIPQALKFLWAPIVDTSFSRKSWYLLGTTLRTLSDRARTAALAASGHSCGCLSSSFEGVAPWSVKQSGSVLPQAVPTAKARRRWTNSRGCSIWGTWPAAGMRSTRASVRRKIHSMI